MSRIDFTNAAKATGAFLGKAVDEASKHTICGFAVTKLTTIKEFNKTHENWTTALKVAALAVDIFFISFHLVSFAGLVGKVKLAEVATVLGTGIYSLGKLAYNHFHKEAPADDKGGKPELVDAKKA